MTLSIISIILSLTAIALRLRDLGIAKRRHDEYVKQLSKGKSHSSKGLTE